VAARALAGGGQAGARHSSCNRGSRHCRVEARFRSRRDVVSHRAAAR
jgi:hypothetical protein